MRRLLTWMISPSLLIYELLLVGAACGFAFAHSLGHSDYAAGTIRGLFLALIPILLLFIYNEARELKKRDDILRSIYVEVVGNLNVIRGMPFDDLGTSVYAFPPLSHVAWELAYVSGTVNLTNLLHAKISKVYDQLSQLNHYLQLTWDLRFKSTYAETANAIEFLNAACKAIYAQVSPLAEEVKQELEAELRIPGDEVSRIRQFVTEGLPPIRKDFPQ